MLLGYWRGPACLGLVPARHARELRADGRPVRGRAPPAHGRGTAGPRPAAPGPRSRPATTGRSCDFPAVLNPRLLAAAELVSPVVGAPETMMRGFFRAAAGPGWALVGDAGHFKHPTTGQGIGDALAQAEHVARRPARRRRPDGLRAVAGRAVRRGLRVLLPRGPTARAGGRDPVRRAGRRPGRRPAVPRHLHPAHPPVRRLHPGAVATMARRRGVRGRPAAPGRPGGRPAGP